MASGQSISRVRPSVRRTVGRTAVKSKYSSGSIEATSSDSTLSRMKETAAEAASPASFQPLKAHTITGLRSFGRPFQMTSCIDVTVPDPVRSSHHDERVAIAERTTSIAELRAGSDIEGVYACVRKDRLTTRSGSPYLALELRDRSGSIQARAFRDADFLAGQFERGDLVVVAGRVERFRDELQVELASIRRAEGADPGAFLPTAYRDLEELDGFLEHLAREVHDDDLLALLGAFLGDEAFRGQLRRAPCTRNGHHSYLGGLLEHTVAVATLALETCVLHPRLNSDLLISAAILHDVGKTREFELGAEIALSDAGALVGHLVLGQQLIGERAAGLDGFPEEKLNALLHCVLAHHGAEAPARAALSLGRGARAPAPERPGRRGQGRTGARPARLGACAAFSGARPRAARRRSARAAPAPRPAWDRPGRSPPRPRGRTGRIASARSSAAARTSAAGTE